MSERISEHEEMMGMLAMIVEEQARTTSAVTMLMEAIAGIRGKAEKAIKESATAANDVVTKAKGSAPAPVAEAPTTPTAPIEAAPAAPTTTAAPTYEDAKEALQPVIKADREKARAILARFGAVKLGDVDPSQFAAVIKACHE